MASNVRDFYDDLSSDYRCIFEDREASMASQAVALAPILIRESGSAAPMLAELVWLLTTSN